jgi:hypothetical protein
VSIGVSESMPTTGERACKLWVVAMVESLSSWVSIDGKLRWCVLFGSERNGLARNGPDETVGCWTMGFVMLVHCSHRLTDVVLALVLLGGERAREGERDRGGGVLQMETNVYNEMLLLLLMLIDVVVACVDGRTDDGFCDV